MNARTVDIPHILDIRRGALKDIVATLSRQFDMSNVVVASGGKVSSGHAHEVVARLASAGIGAQLVDDLSGTVDHVDQLAALLRDGPASLVLGVGGGRPLDVAKLAASREGVPFVAVPTVLSHDGICSPVASLADATGTRRSLAARTPEGVVIDLDVVSEAPIEFTRAGIGDLISNLVAVSDWRRAAAEGEGVVDELAASIALQSALPVFDVQWPLDEVGWHLVARGLVMSGLAMAVAGNSRPCSGAEHLISHALDALLGPAAHPHGEQVALGVLLVSAASGIASDRVRELYVRIGFPSTLAEWGVDRSVLEAAVALAPSTRPDRPTILDSIDGSAEAIRSLIEAVFPDASGTEGLASGSIVPGPFPHVTKETIS